MPIMDFECSSCNVVTEEIVKFNTEQITCPECGGIADKALSLGCAFHLKGSGWYADGYETKSNKQK